MFFHWWIHSSIKLQLLNLFWPVLFLIYHEHTTSISLKNHLKVTKFQPKYSSCVFNLMGEFLNALICSKEHPCKLPRRPKFMRGTQHLLCLILKPFKLFSILTLHFPKAFNLQYSNIRIIRLNLS